jgi:type IV secretion system protein VirB4
MPGDAEPRAVAPRHWRHAGRDVPLARFIPWSSQVNDTDVVTRGGDFLRIWRLGGLAFECADRARVAEAHEALANLLRNLTGGEFAIWSHVVRRQIADALSAPVEAGFAATLDSAYRARQSSHSLMATELYLTLVFRRYTSASARLFARRLRTGDQVVRDQANAVRMLDEQGAMLERTLREFEPQRLGVVVRAGRRYSEPLEFLRYLVTGRWAAVPVLTGALFRHLAGVRMFFGGQNLELRDAQGSRFAAVVDIADYPKRVEPGTLDALLYEDASFIQTQSFAPLSRRSAMAALETQKRQLLASDDAVFSQVEEMDEAIDGVGAGDYTMGEYYYSLVVFGGSLKEAAQRAARAAGSLSETAAIQMSPVDLVADAAYFAQWPGNFPWRARQATISSRAFAALACQHNFAGGKRDGNPWGEAVSLLRTPSGQPYYFNFHASPDQEESLDQKHPGNTLILGVTGAGKTTLELFLLTQAQKFSPRPRIVLFDFDRGAEIFVRALRGRYFTLRLGEPTGLNPFEREATDGRRQAWEALVRKCVESPALPLLPRDEQAIHEAVRAVALLPAKLRRMSTLRQNLPRDGANSLYDRLGRWCQGGALGWVFDEAPDRLGDLAAAPIIGVDYTQFLGVPEVRTPVMMVLLGVLAELMDGSRFIYAISEFWKALDDEVFSAFARQEQKTIRKKNGLGIFDTQSPSDVLGSSIGRTIVEQSVTKICLPNPDAVASEYIEGFGFTPGEYEIVKSLGSRGSRQFLVKQGHHSAIAELDLSGMDDALLVLSGSSDNVVLLDEIRAQLSNHYGDDQGDDPDVWLPLLTQAVRARRTRRTGAGAR